MFLCVCLCHKCPQVYLHHKNPNKELHLESDHHFEKMFILKQQTYSDGTVSTLVSQSPQSDFGVGRLVDGWIGLAMHGSSLPPCDSVPSSWKPPRQGDGTAPLGWPECSIKRQPSLEEACPPKQSLTNTGQSYRCDSLIFWL